MSPGWWTMSLWQRVIHHKYSLSKQTHDPLKISVDIGLNYKDATWFQIKWQWFFLLSFTLPSDSRHSCSFTHPRLLSAITSSRSKFHFHQVLLSIHRQPSFLSPLLMFSIPLSHFHHMSGRPGFVRFLPSVGSSPAKNLRGWDWFRVCLGETVQPYC